MGRKDAPSINVHVSSSLLMFLFPSFFLTFPSQLGHLYQSTTYPKTDQPQSPCQACESPAPPCQRRWLQDPAKRLFEVASKGVSAAHRRPEICTATVESEVRRLRGVNGVGRNVCCRSVWFCEEKCLENLRSESVWIFCEARLCITTKA